MGFFSLEDHVNVHESEILLRYFHSESFSFFPSFSFFFFVTFKNNHDYRYRPVPYSCTANPTISEIDTCFIRHMFSA